MKLHLFHILTRQASYVRLLRIQHKKKLREQRIEEAFEYLQKWNDIPISQLAPTVCDVLRIKRNKAALDLIYRMNMDLKPEDLVKIIPLSA